MTKDKAQEMSIQDCVVTHLKYVLQNNSDSLFYGPMSCTRAHSIMCSTYKSVQYHGQCVQEHTAS